MTLDPVHFDGIARLASRISQDVDETEHRDLATTVWREWLDPLASEGRVVLEPLGEHRRRVVGVEAAALQDDEFPTQHGLDSGTINPTTFTNGLVLDVAQAAMSASPSDLDLHRSRTVVMTVHVNDVTANVEREDWEHFDGEFSKGRIRQVPPVSRFEEGVVHALALYLSESNHALDNADRVEDLLVLDGPLYPKGILKWADRHPELADLLHERQAREVLQNYVSLVETFVARDVPLVGFVKNPATKTITRTIRRKENGPDAPWIDDAAFFTKVLQRTDGEGTARDPRDRETDVLTFTDWFVSRGGADRPLSAEGNGLDLERELPPESYEVTFCMVYDPRDDVIYRIEAPRAFTRDADLRERLTMQLVKDVAAERGPPLAISKADELARISREEKASLRRTLEETFETNQDRTYDDVRWDGEG